MFVESTWPFNESFTESTFASNSSVLTSISPTDTSKPSVFASIALKSVFMSSNLKVLLATSTTAPFPIDPLPLAEAVKVVPKSGKLGDIDVPLNVSHWAAVVVPKLTIS